MADMMDMRTVVKRAAWTDVMMVAGTEASLAATLAAVLDYSLVDARVASMVALMAAV
jgi:hypothetical protein